MYFKHCIFEQHENVFNIKVSVCIEANTFFMKTATFYIYSFYTENINYLQFNIKNNDVNNVFMQTHIFLVTCVTENRTTKKHKSYLLKVLIYELFEYEISKSFNINFYCKFLLRL